jgi:hypothetical protein
MVGPTDVLTPSPCVAGQLGPKAAWPTCNVTAAIAADPKCTREEIVIAPNATTTFRIINAATLVYTTVCFGGHNVTVVASDARATEPVTFKECVDVNSGQRLDVEVKADQAGGVFWISCGWRLRVGARDGVVAGSFCRVFKHAACQIFFSTLADARLTARPRPTAASALAASGQYRKGAPSAFGVMRYKGSASPALPPGPQMQPQEANSRKWSVNDTMKVGLGEGASDDEHKAKDQIFAVQHTLAKDSECPLTTKSNCDWPNPTASSSASTPTSAPRLPPPAATPPCRRRSTAASVRGQTTDGGSPARCIDKAVMGLRLPEVKYSRLKCRHPPTETTHKPTPPHTPPHHTPTQTVLNIAQPIMPNGLVRWAMNNMAHAETPR